MVDFQLRDLWRDNAVIRVQNKGRVCVSVCESAHRLKNSISRFNHRVLFILFVCLFVPVRMEKFPLSVWREFQPFFFFSSSSFLNLIKIRISLLCFLE